MWGGESRDRDQPGKTYLEKKITSGFALAT
jgi:hypothetical protein